MLEPKQKIRDEVFNSASVSNRKYVERLSPLFDLAISKTTKAIFDDRGKIIDKLMKNNDFWRLDKEELLDRIEQELRKKYGCEDE